MRAPTATFVVILLSFSTSAVPASAFDLTGHWVGKYSCKGFAAPFTDDGKQVNKYTTSHPQSTLDITQTGGGAFGAVIDLNNGPFRYNAFAMTSVKSNGAGEVVLLGCSTANTLPSASSGAEILRASVKTKNGVVKASFKGVSIFADNFPEVETCKYSYTRVDSADPNVDICE